MIVLNFKFILIKPGKDQQISREYFWKMKSDPDLVIELSNFKTEQDNK